MEDAESGMSEAANQQAQDWVRKSRKRRQSASSFEARWDGLPPLAQLEFAREVVLPSTQTGVRRFGPGRSDLARLAELAPLHWHALGPNFGKAFLRRASTSVMGRGNGASRAIFKSIQRETATTRRMTRVLVASTWFVFAF